MRILTDPLPDQVEIDGASYPINPDYRIMMRFSAASETDETSETDFLRILIDFFRGSLPPNLEKAVESLCWFASCGKHDSPNKRVTPSLKKQDRGLSFYADQGLIYAAFREAYHLDLTESHMHWWLFNELLNALPDDVLLMRVIHWRLADIKKLPKAQREFYRRMKETYAIRKKSAPKTYEEHKEQMLSYVQRRFAETERRVTDDGS